MSNQNIKQKNDLQLLIAKKETKHKYLLIIDAIFNISLYISGIAQFIVFCISGNERKKFLAADLGQVSMALLLMFSFILVSFCHYLSRTIDSLKNLYLLKYQKNLKAFEEKNNILISEFNLIDKIDEKFFSHLLCKILKDLFNFFYIFIDILLVMGLTSYGQDFSLFTYLDLREKQIANQTLYPSYSNYSLLSAICLSVCLLILIYQIILLINDLNKQRKDIKTLDNAEQMKDYIALQKQKFQKQKFELFNLSFRFFATTCTLGLYLKRGMSFGDINTGYTKIDMPTLFFGILMICGFIFNIIYLILDNKVDNLEKKHYNSQYMLLDTINAVLVEENSAKIG
ncbi:MAG: hypothetical protein OEY79_00050 [Anaplasmataceae bacterium]|nr:hypothetical protein [Anaplasmataceae bacterium]